MTNSAGALEVSETTRTESSPDSAWQSIGDFCAIADWHPAVERCSQRDEGGTTRRTLELAGGGTLVEDLVSRDDAERTYTYRIVEGPLPVRDYQSTLYVTEDGGSTVIGWAGTFRAAEDSNDAEAEAVIRGIYRAGLDALRKGSSRS